MHRSHNVSHIFEHWTSVKQTEQKTTKIFTIKLELENNLVPHTNKAQGMCMLPVHHSIYTELTEMKQHFSCSCGVLMHTIYHIGKQQQCPLLSDHFVVLYQLYKKANKICHTK